MKNIQVIDGAQNAAYDIYQATEDEFALVFPQEGQDIQFAEDLKLTANLEEAFENIWSRLIDKKEAQGIHGTLFYELQFKKKYYPNKKESDLTDQLGRPQILKGKTIC